MSFLVSKTQPALSEAENNAANNSTEDQEDQEMLCGARVTTHVHLKPAHSSQTLDKDVVLRRIRQRKCANKVRSVLQGFLGFPTSSKPDKVSVRWVDDAFAAP
ncbi:conserved hypothetical protein [Ricinus communis]|uniref:Uncharacterized protein n=1 Tax=Ricinus communis TaxID=3988 RepID=B9R7M5_RICCO|nr:conserved hypothetical protein [Ricinus communis]